MKITTTILLFVISATSFAQRTTPKEEAYKILSAHNIFNSPYRETAKKAFEDYISKYPTNPYRLVATYCLAEILNNINELDSASLRYSEVLRMSIPDSVDDANYRRSSAIRLAEICITKNDYISALNYLGHERQKFVFRFDCGNSRIEDDMKIKALYSSCFIGQGNYNAAIDTLAPYMFFGSYGDNTIIIDKLYEAYLKIYTKEEIKNEFLNAEKNLLIKQEQYYLYSYLQPTTEIFGKEIKFQDYNYNLNELTEQERKQKCIEMIRQSRMYKLATR